MADVSAEVVQGHALGYLPTDDEIRRMYRLAEGLAQSGVFKDTRQAAQAFAKIIVGRDLGMSPAQAMMGIQFVEGGIQLHYSTLGARVRSRPGYNYRIFDLSNESASIEFTVDEESVGVSTFTQADAKAAGKTGGNYAKWPRNMLIARAMSNGCKWFVPEVLQGLPVYVPGEIVESTATDVTDGHGDGSPAGIDLGPKVEALLERATAVGYPLDRGTVELQLGSRSPETVAQWVKAMSARIDAANVEQSAVDGEPADTGVVDPAEHHRDPTYVTAKRAMKGEPADAETVTGAPGEVVSMPGDEYDRAQTGEERGDG